MPIESWYPKHIAREAAEWTGTYSDLPAAWRRMRAFEEVGDGGLLIVTNHGMTRAEKGDYIARDVAGSFYPVKRAVWLATYERA